MPLAAARRDKSPSKIFTDPEFAKLCEYFYRRTGIMFAENKRYFVERRVEERMHQAGCEAFRDYFSLIRFQSSGEEMQRLVNQLTVNETYFLREQYQFSALAAEILPEVVKDREAGSTVRIWSMPCSTGEEPYSIAISILESWSRADDFAIEISASDIDSRVLSMAQRGIYSERSVHRVSTELRSKYFARLANGDHQICDDIRNSIDFSLANIMNPNHTARYRSIDVIFCRNMLIYFDDVSRRQAAEAFYECLTPGGFICLGHSESMGRISSLFTPRKFLDTIVYQKSPLVE